MDIQERVFWIHLLGLLLAVIAGALFFAITQTEKISGIIGVMYFWGAIVGIGLGCVFFYCFTLLALDRSHPGGSFKIRFWRFPFWTLQQAVLFSIFIIPIASALGWVIAVAMWFNVIAGTILSFFLTLFPVFYFICASMALAYPKTYSKLFGEVLESSAQSDPSPQVLKQ